ncbi:MAG TPA: hypothetical protein DCG49_13055 [Ruminococcus sp.]|nr:hypothetical protein [Ruminococcus sp.]
MPLINAKCTNCGAVLEVDPTKDAMICKACGSAFVVEKAINNYQTSITNHIQASTVNIMQESPDFIIWAGMLVKYSGENPDVTLPSHITIVGSSAFKDCVGLRSVVIPEGVVSIEPHAFSGCTNLRLAELPDSLNEIGNFAFTNCTNLAEIKIPANVKRIGDYAFFGCAALTVIDIPESVARIGNGAFQGCDHLSRANLPPNVQVALNSFASGNLNPRESHWEQEHADGCYIATCVYGSYDCPQVWMLRRYRDRILAPHACGRAFIRLYYAISPKLVKWFGETAWFRRFWRRFLDRKIVTLREKGFSDKPYRDIRQKGAGQ